MQHSMLITLVACVLPLYTVVASSESGAKDSKPTSENFILIGEERTVPYDHFAGLPPDICSTLKNLHLEYIQFDANALIESLKSCKELRNITLLNVEYTGTILKTVELTKLEAFSFTMHHMHEDSTDQFMAHLFFYNPKTKQVIPPSVDIRVSSFMTDKSVKYDSNKRRLELRFFYDYDLSRYFEYNELMFLRSSVDLNALKLFNLTAFELHNDYYEDGLFQVLSSAKKLIDLRVYQMRQDGTFQSLSFDLSIFPRISDFETLVLQHARVGSSKPIKLQKLASLTLFVCEFNASLILISSSVSELYLENVTFYGDSLDSFVSRMDNLTTVSLDYRIHRNQEFDIASFRKSTGTLRDLNLYSINLRLSSSDVEFQVLEHVGFFECEFQESLNTKLSKTFRGINALSISECNIPYIPLQDLLNTSVEKFYYSRNKIEILEIENFLLESDVPSSVKSPQLRRSNGTSTGWLYVTNRSHLQKSWLRDSTLYTYVLVLAVICGIGIVGNILSGIVLTRKSMRSSTSCILFGLAICDFVILTTYACSLLYFGIKLIFVFFKFTMSWDDRQYYHILGFEVSESAVRRLDEFQYCFLYPINKTAYTGSVYATILLTAERYVAVCWPTYVRRMLKLKTAIVNTILVLVFAVVLNFPRWIEAQQYSSQIYWYIPNVEADTDYRAVTLYFDRHTYGSGLLRNRFYRQYYHGLLWVMLMYVVPISGLTFCNFRILAQLKKSEQSRNSTISAHQTRDQKETASLTKMLLCIIMIFVICNSLSGVIVWTLIWYGGWDPSDIEVFSCIPLIINCSINFAIYALLGVKFQAEWRKLISSFLRFFCRIERRDVARNSIRMTTMATTGE